MKLVIVGAHLRREDIEPEAMAVPAGPIFLSALEVAGDQPLGDRDLLLRVADVRARLLERATFIAVRYGFAARSADEAAAKCADRVIPWRNTLEKQREHVELTLKVVTSQSGARPQRDSFRSGADYLRALHKSAHAGDIAPAFREAVSRLGTHRWSYRPDGALECALLVPRDSVAVVMKKGEQLKRDFPDIAFLLSGPWPLEVFADDHE